MLGLVFTITTTETTIPQKNKLLQIWLQNNLLTQEKVKSIALFFSDIFFCLFSSSFRSTYFRFNFASSLRIHETLTPSFHSNGDVSSVLHDASLLLTTNLDSNCPTEMERSIDVECDS